MDLSFTKCEKQLKAEDILKIEKSLSITLPDDFKNHFLRFNGGKPNKTIWRNTSCEIQHKEIREFIPMLYAKDFLDDPSFTLEGRTKEEWENGRLPRKFIQFAMDWYAHYFCINHTTGEVFYFLRDSLSNHLSPEETLLVKNTPLASSFTEFLNSLEVDDEAG